MDCESDLARDRFHQRDLGARPGPGRRSVGDEDADHPVEHRDRGREDGRRPEPGERVESGQVVGDLGRRLNVADRYGLEPAGGEIRDRQRRGIAGDRAQPLAVPLSRDRHRPAGLAKPDEAAIDPERSPRLLDGDLVQGVDVELGADAPRDLGDDALPVEGVGERRG